MSRWFRERRRGPEAGTAGFPFSLHRSWWLRAGAIDRASKTCYRRYEAVVLALRGDLGLARGLRQACLPSLDPGRCLPVGPEVASHAKVVWGVLLYPGRHGGSGTRTWTTRSGAGSPGHPLLATRGTKKNKRKRRTRRKEKGRLQPGMGIPGGGTGIGGGIGSGGQVGRGPGG